MPAKSIWWTISQTLAWIHHREHAAIGMISPSTTPFDILIDFFGLEADGGDRGQRLASALIVRDDFLEKVKGGQLAIWASRSSDGTMEIVSAADWLSIDALAGNNPKFPPDALGGNYDDKPRYYRATALSSDVITIWPRGKIKRSTDLEIKRVVEEAIRKKGGRLTIDEIDDLELQFRAENSTVQQREKFRQMQISLRGAGTRGRKSNK